MSRKIDKKQTHTPPINDELKINICNLCKVTLYQLEKQNQIIYQF